MPEIIVITEINAPVEICFDAARSIDVHSESTAQTREKAITGRTSGLCEKGDTVTWEATHFGIRQKLQSEISEMDRPFYFQDQMLKGAFKSIDHKHFFKFENGKTIMTDNFNYKSPLGWLGKLADKLFLEKYMRKFIVDRNNFIKMFCEKKVE
jgi:ligand-binding SRPBCC domain-containing protein